MFERILRQFRERVRSRQFVMTLHAVEEMEDDRLTVLDVEHAILTGKMVERQPDIETSEWKYVVKGLSLLDEEIVVVAKLSPTGKLVIITTYAD